MHKTAVQTLGSGDMRLAVQRPEGEDEHEWMAVHTVDCYNELSLLVGAIVEQLTEDRFPKMRVKGNEYRWADSQHPTPIAVSAPAYFDYVLTWVQANINDEAIFPVSVDVSFPANFKETVSSMFRRMFRLYAFLYDQLYDDFKAIMVDGPEGDQAPASAHLNTCFKHFLYFTLEFDLVSDEELSVMQDLIDAILAKDGMSVSTAAAAAGT